MFLTRRQLVFTLSVTAIYLIAQVLVGTDVKVAWLFSIAIFFGILAVFAGGGIASAFGCLNAVLIGKFLLAAIAIKAFLLEPSDRPLHAPEATACVMAIGFVGVFLGTVLQFRFRCPQVLSMNRPFSKQMLLSLSIVLFVFSYIGYFISMLPGTQGLGTQTGGWIGISHVLGSLKSLAIVPPMLYLWRSKTHLWMTHPVVLCMLAWSGVVGIFSTGKQEAIEPLLFYVLVGFLRYGWRDMRLWSLVLVGAVYYALIIFPYSEYVRSTGGRAGSFEERAQITKDTFWRIATNQEFRSEVTDNVSKDTYFDPSLAAFSRLAMVGEADRLIDATERQKSYTGWETITLGFKMLLPSFLYPDKPVYSAGNYLAHIAGDLSAGDTTTGVSYGLMANLYNAFSFTGVLVGTPILFAGFFYWIRIFLGDPKWEGMPTASTLWFIWLVASYHHSIVESSVSGLISSLSFPSVIVLLCMLAKWCCLFFPAEDLGLEMSFARQS